jgi:hypothetical protein
MGHLGRHRAPAPRVPEQTSGGTSIDRSGDGASMRHGRLGWYCYDWASAVFTTVLTSVFFGPYVTSVAERAVDAQGHVRPLGIPVAAGSYFPYLVSLSVAVQIVVLPAAAALTRRHDKGRVLAVPALTGAVATLCMSATGDTSPSSRRPRYGIAPRRWRPRRAFSAAASCWWPAWSCRSTTTRGD